MLKTPTRVSISRAMPVYYEKRDNTLYVCQDTRETLPKNQGKLPLGSARSLGNTDNVPRLTSPPNWAYRTMIPAEKRLSTTWAKPFLEDRSISGKFITYGDEPVEEKRWNKFLPYYESDPVAPPPRQYYSDVAPFVPEATSDFFTTKNNKLRPPFARGVLADTSVPAARPKSDNGLGSLWTDIVSTSNTLLKTAGDIYSTYQAGEIAKTQSQIVQAQVQATQAAATQAARAKSTLWSYLPWVVGIGGGALLLKLLIGKKR